VQTLDYLYLFQPVGEYYDVKGIRPAKDRDQRRVLVNTVTDLLVP